MTEYRHWTEEEDQYLREHYKNTKKIEMMRHLGRTAYSIKNRARTLGVQNPSEARRVAAEKLKTERKRKEWAEQEEEIDNIVALQDVLEASELVVEAMKRCNVGERIGSLIQRLERANSIAKKSRRKEFFYGAVRMD